MTTSPLPSAELEHPTEDNAKRRQILEGARQVFRAKGFDGASMETIAKAANVSKGTLYVYFDSKEALFEALIMTDRFHQGEALLEVGSCSITDDISADLKRLGSSYVRHMVNSEKVSTLRMVIGAAEKFPQFAQMLYEAGPRTGAEKFGAYLRKRIESGDIRECDTTVAAAHFLDLCVARILRQLLFSVDPAPTPEEMARNVDIGVDVFLAAYGTKKN